MTHGIYTTIDPTPRPVHAFPTVEPTPVHVSTGGVPVQEAVLPSNMQVYVDGAPAAYPMSQVGVLVVVTLHVSPTAPLAHPDRPSETKGSHVTGATGAGAAVWRKSYISNCAQNVYTCMCGCQLQLVSRQHACHPHGLKYGSIPALVSPLARPVGTDKHCQNELICSQCLDTTCQLARWASASRQLGCPTYRHNQRLDCN